MFAPVFMADMILARLGMCAGAATIVKASHSSNVRVYKRGVFRMHKRVPCSFYR